MRPHERLQGMGAGAHRQEGATVEGRLKLRRAQLRMEVRWKASSAQQPEQRMGSGRGDEHGAGTGARGGRVAGGKRKATAAGAWEAVRAEKVRREVHWAHVRAAMCAVLHRARRRERGKGQQRKKRTGHTPGTTTSVANEAVVNAEASVVREAKTENRPKRKCKDIPPGTYAPVKRIRGAPPAHCRFTRRSAGVAPMAVTAVSRPVVVDEGSFLDALFAPAGQDRRAMEHRPQDPGPRRRTIDWRLDDRGALEARLGNVFNEHQVCNSNLIRSL